MCIRTRNEAAAGPEMRFDAAIAAEAAITLLVKVVSEMLFYAAVAPRAAFSKNRFSMFYFMSELGSNLSAKVGFYSAIAAEAAISK